MKFETLGKKEDPALLLIHGMFCTAESCMPFANLLKNDYYIILPTLDGHYDGSDHLTDVTHEAKKIVSYLHKERIGSLELLQGTSMGAEVALAVAANCDLPIRHYFFDGGPFFDFPGWFKFIMFKKFQRIVKKCAGKTEDEILKDPLVRNLGGDNLESFRGMIGGFTQLANFMTKQNIKAITEICYNCQLPEFDPQVQRKFVFFFSKKEPAHMSQKRLKKKYPKAIYKEYPGNTHCGFQTTKPAAYAKYLRKVIAGDQGKGLAVK